MTLLKIENLCFSYRKERLLENFSLELFKGQFLHLTGPNGQGKTTLLRLAAGLMLPDSGSVERYASLEYLPAEKKGFYLRQSGFENLKFFLGLKGSSAVENALLRVKLPKTSWHKPVSHYSTGMKQRLAYARLMDSTIWLLDEPLNGVDRDGTEIFETLMLEHLLKGGCVLLTGHLYMPPKSYNAIVLNMGQPT